MAKAPKNLDEFFKEKLEQHSVKPSALAWERLENQLPQKPESNKGLWWATAASISLLLMAGYLFYPKSDKLSGETLMTEEVQQETVRENQPEIEEPAILESSPAQTPPEETQKPISRPVRKPETQKKPKPTSTPSFKTAPQNLISQTEAVPTEEIKSVQRPDLRAETPEVSFLSPDTRSLNQTVTEAKTTEEPLYRVSIYSDGIKKEDVNKNLITELGKTVGTGEGFIGKVDNGLADLQDAKNNLFATLTTKKERADQKP